jgi:Sulfotransferase domain
MINQLIYAAKYMLGLDHAGNNLTVFPDDTFLVSYPKSGNTWTRFLIGNLIYPEGVDFSNINEKIPDPGALAKRYLKRLPRPRYIKSHNPYDPRYRKVILIVRDPRDVVLSEYHFDIKCRAIPEEFPIERFVRQWLDGEVNHEFGSWGANVGSWLAARRNTRDFLSGRTLLLLRYEDMIDDPGRELARVAAFLNIPSDAGRISNAVQRSSADIMRKMETAQSHLWSSTKDTRKDRPFVRAAKYGGWKTELPNSCTLDIESQWRTPLAELGYELQSETPELRNVALRT